MSSETENETEYNLFKSFIIGPEFLKWYRILAALTMGSLFSWASIADDNIEDFKLLTHWGLMMGAVYFGILFFCYVHLGTDESNLHYMSNILFEVCYAFQCVVLGFYFYVSDPEDENREGKSADFIKSFYFLGSHVITPVLIFLEGLLNRLKFEGTHLVVPVLIYISYVVSNFLSSRNSEDTTYEKIKWDGEDDTYFYVGCGLAVTISGFLIGYFQSKVKQMWLERGIVKSFKKKAKFF